MHCSPLLRTFHQCQPFWDNVFFVIRGFQQHSGQPENKASKDVHGTRTFREIPEPSSSIPILGTALDYSSLRGFSLLNLYDHFRNRHEALGSIYKENVLPGLTEYSVFYSSPNDTSKVLKNEGKHPGRQPLDWMVNARLEHGRDVGLTQKNGKEWQKLRTVTNKFLLNNSSVWAYTKQHQEVANDFASFLEGKLDENREVTDLVKLLKLWSLEASAVFNLDTRLGLLRNDPSSEAKQLIKCVNTMFDSMARLLFGVPMWKIYKTKTLKEYEQGSEKIFQLCQKYQDLAESAHDKKGTKCFFKDYLKNTSLSFEEKEAMIHDFLIGGIDTTSYGAVFPLYLLARHPDKQEKLREEILSATAEDQITGRRLNQLPYFHSFMQESQRVFPFLGLWFRRLDKDIVLSNYCIPAETDLFNTSNLINAMNPEYFENPQKFIPERWLDSKQRQRARFAMIGSFGQGPRKCPGRQFALQEIHCLLIAILTRYRLEYHHDPIEGKFRVFTVPSVDPRIRFFPLK